MSPLVIAVIVVVVLLLLAAAWYMYVPSLASGTYLILAHDDKGKEYHLGADGLILKSGFGGAADPRSQWKITAKDSSFTVQNVATSKFIAKSTVTTAAGGVLLGLFDAGTPFKVQAKSGDSLIVAYLDSKAPVYWSTGGGGVQSEKVMKTGDEWRYRFRFVKQ